MLLRELLDGTSNLILLDERLLVDPTEETLNEFVMFLPLLAVAARLGGKALIKMATTQGAKQVATKVVTSSTKVGGKVAVNVGKTLVKNPLKTVGTGYALDNKDSIEAFLDGLGVARDIISEMVELIKKYSLPVAAVVAVLYGGKKLYDYIQSNKDEKVELISNDTEDQTKLILQ